MHEPIGNSVFQSRSRTHKTDNYQGVIGDYTKAIEIEPKCTIANDNRSITKDELTDFKGAIADYTKAIEINPQDADAYFNRGGARGLANDLETACGDWRKAVDLGLEKQAEWVKNQC